MITGRINFLAQRNEPNPLEVTYWVDLGADPNGGVIKCYDGKKWNNITGEDSSVANDIASLYASVASLQLTKLNKSEYESFVEECNDAHNTLNSTKANKSTTLSGYGITDAYTKTQTDSKINELASSKVSELVGGAPETLDTLNELAAALGDDPNFATTMTNLIGTKANKTDVYTKAECTTVINNAISSSNHVSSTSITEIKVIDELPQIQETGVLYIKKV